MKVSKAQLQSGNGHEHYTINTKTPSLSVSSEQDVDEDQSPPMSPLRLPQLSSSNSSISSWASSSQGSQSPSEPSGSEPLMTGCNSKEERASFNTKFARYHLETYRQNDRMRWNFDFDQNRPLDDSHHNHYQSVARYQWEPAI